MVEAGSPGSTYRSGKSLSKALSISTKPKTSPIVITLLTLLSSKTLCKKCSKTRTVNPLIKALMEKGKPTCLTQSIPGLSRTIINDNPKTNLSAQEARVVSNMLTNLKSDLPQVHSHVETTPKQSYESRKFKLSLKPQSCRKYLTRDNDQSYKTFIPKLKFKVTRNNTLDTLSPSCFCPANFSFRKDHPRSAQNRLIRSGDIEENPGPEGERRDPNGATLMVTSYNVRGLNDEKKLRHLINKIYKEDKGKNFDSFVCLQETYVPNSGKIPYLWRGNLHLTPGNGSSCGCLTLTSSHINVIHATDIDNRAHVIACQRSSDTAASYIVANIYAPNPNNSDKIEFYDKVFETVSELSDRFDCPNILIAGDFNLVFTTTETKNRNYSAQEKRVAKFVKDKMSELNLADSWEGHEAFSWRRPNTNTFSLIDRILYSRQTIDLTEIKDNWSYSFSDHAAVMAKLKLKNKKTLLRSKITRLDPSLVKSAHYRPLIEQGFNSLIETMPVDWNPHLKLEFAKMSIRTVVEKIQASRKREESSEEENLNEELDTAIGALASGHGGNQEQNLIDYVEELRAKKQVIIEEKGARLAERLGTKWFNEGEKSSRYFLRLLNRSLPDNFELLQGVNGEIISDPEDIEKSILDFYKKLYEDAGVTVKEDDQDFFNLIEPISGEVDEEIAVPLTLGDLRTTLDTCADSAPGPDGIPYSFIKLLWPTFGKILCDAWHYSLERNCLPPSHKNSFLKLIPKAGKDLSKLTNWRPITLSNCDHKIITKTYTRKLCEKVAPKICGNQTAYLKGRLINDNIRAILSTINLSNIEAIEGLIVSLDAKKAFDSVDHGYIEACLRKFGCSKFVPIFKTLYKDLKTDIIVNGKIVPGFKINRGVKQGDALSCILFIMCMEPLLRNINSNQEIKALRSNILSCELPKTYAYADDVNCIMCGDSSLKELFKEYERLTLASGLELNADKTEIMRLGEENEATFNVRYKEADHQITTQQEIKINGIFFQRNREVVLQRNVDAVVEKMDAQFKSWNKRSLSTLGKILIAKTFGISQAIILMQSVTLKDVHFKKLNSVLYKFIWNRHYAAAKAPERIKRDIVNNSIKNGGFGMLDIKELDESLKIRAIGRLIITTHPFQSLLKDKLNFESYFNPKLLVEEAVDPIVNEGLAKLKEDRNKLWEDPYLDADRKLIATIRGLKLREIVDQRGHNSIAFFNLWNRGARRVADLTPADLGTLRRHIGATKINKLMVATGLNLGWGDPSFNKTYYLNKLHKPLDKITSKEVRCRRSTKNPVTELKIGTNLSVLESRSWGEKMSKLTSTRHKNIILRVAHGDVYTQSKLYRFGMVDTDRCPRCNEAESLAHKFINCEYIRRIWRCAMPLINRMQSIQDPNQDLVKKAIAANLSSNTASMTYTAELLQTILYFKPDQTYLIHPKTVALRVLKNLAIKEGNTKIKGIFIELLNEVR